MYIKEHLEDITKLYKVAAELEECGANVFIDYQSHVNWLEIEIYSSGWKENVSRDNYKRIYLDEPQAKETFIEVIELMLETLDKIKE